jgi:hypothetical protein
MIIVNSILITNNVRLCDETQLRYRLQGILTSNEDVERSFKLLEPYVNKEFEAQFVLFRIWDINNFDKQKDDPTETYILAVRNMYLLTEDLGPLLPLEPELYKTLLLNGLSLLQNHRQDFYFSYGEIMDILSNWENTSPEEKIPEKYNYMLAVRHKNFFVYYQWILKRESKCSISNDFHNTLWRHKVVKILMYVPYLIDDLMEDLIIARDDLKSETFDFTDTSESLYSIASYQFMTKIALISDIERLLELHSKFE